MFQFLLILLFSSRSLCLLLPDLNNIVSGPLDTMGYIPVSQAVTKCENIARWRVEEELTRSVDTINQYLCFLVTILSILTLLSNDL